MKSLGHAGLVLGLLVSFGCGAAPEGELAGDTGQAGATSAESLGEAQAEVVGPSWVRRGAAAIEVNRGNGGQELWVVVCADEKLKFRLKKINGSWSSWVNTAAPCTATPSLAAWPYLDSPEVPVAYFRNGNDLMEMTFMATNIWQLVNISQATGFGALQDPGQMDPAVSYFNTEHKQISILAGRKSDNTLYSIDYYSKKWHLRPVVGGAVPATSRTVPWFSKNIGEQSFFSYPIAQLHVIFHRDDIINAYAPWKVLDDTNLVWQHVVSFGGPDPSCVDEGCLMTLSQTTDDWGRWAPLGPGNPEWQDPFHFLGWHLQAPITRHGGDPMVMFSFAGTRNSNENKLMMMAFDPVEYHAANVPGTPNSIPVLPVNVYAGSKYERDMFYTQDNAGKRALYYVSYDSVSRSFTFKDMGIDVSYSL